MSDKEGFIQWKGTDICMDFHCSCGYHNHYDGFFAYHVKCKGCGKVYQLDGKIKMTEVKGDFDPLESNI